MMVVCPKCDAWRSLNVLFKPKNSSSSIVENLFNCFRQLVINGFLDKVDFWPGFFAVFVRLQPGSINWG